MKNILKIKSFAFALIRSIRLNYIVFLLFFYFSQFISFNTINSSAGLYASHLMGGEITWACQGNGQYIFRLKFYRDCNGINTPNVVSLSVFNHPSVSSIQLNQISQTDISPSCNSSGPTISCANAQAQQGWPTSTTPVAGAVQESVFESAPISLPGIPPAQGWIFAYSDCCRNGSLTNLQNANSYGFTLRAVMYSYNGQSADPCFDSSPTFLESPSTVICLGSSFSYNHNAYDPDLDSLSYSWAQPLDDFSGPFALGTNPAPVPFANGYSFNSPLPGTTQDPSNVPATINSRTGEISFTSHTQGYFVTNVKVEAWKCGTLVAEIYREIQVVLLPCAVNNMPSVTYSSYQTTVSAGTLVSFTLTGNDNGLLPNGSPQTLTINASGTQFGTNFTNASAGCLNPPCATLSHSLPFSAPSTVATTFNWQTTCDHISYNATCATVSNTYTFVFRVKDDFCPAPSENISTVSITVLATPIVSSPEPNCVSVQSNGDVQLTWTTPPDPSNTFNGYFIYSSTSPNGPFNVVDSILNYTTNTYTHVGANANSAQVFYLIKTRSGCFGQVFSPAYDTISTIHLTVNNPANGTALLSWNAIASPDLPTSSGVYTIYEKNGSGIWVARGTSSSLSYIDTILDCNATIDFKVEIADNSGCTSASSTSSGTFQNIIVPNIPLFDTLSVDDSNNAIMSWYVDPAPDVTSYIIYQLIGGAKIPIDTVIGINSTSFNYTFSNADLNAEEYYLAAIDSCGNISPIGSPQNTMFLSAIAQVCARSAVLSWTPYVHLGTGVSAYNILQSTTGVSGPYTQIGSVDQFTFTYTATSLAPQTTYYFKIQVVDSSGTKFASSNRLTFYSATPMPPTFSYLRKVSVHDPDEVDITCHIDVTASTSAYKIMRSKDTVHTHFNLVATLPASATTPVTYSDFDVSTDNYSYYYKVINVDSCGFDGLETNIGRTILLTAIGNSETLKNTLSWNDYESWLGNVASYNIYRGIDGTLDPNPIANIVYSNSGTNNYIDDVSLLTQGQGIFNYYIEAQEGMGNIYTFTENSLSNTADAYIDPKVFIPNAFRPSGEFNKIFKPVTTFVNFTEYDFSIFNRWGDEVFTTSDPQIGWDGTDKNRKSEFGLYIYIVHYKNSKGEYIEQKGTITLLR